MSSPGVVVFNTEERTLVKAMIPPSTTSPADHHSAAWKPATNSVLDTPVGPNPATSGTAATASKPPTRATALLTPDATPECCASAAASTVAVKGATVNASPPPNTNTAGSTASMYERPGSIRTISTRPHAMTNGPIVIGHRGPIRCASSPARAENTNMITVSGTVAA